MINRIILIACLFVSMNMQAQNADKRIGSLINESNWFELEEEVKVVPTDSISPFILELATAMTHHYFNRPDSACAVISDLLSNYQQELGGQTMNMVILLSINLARTGQYNEAAGIMQDLCDQLSSLGMDSTQIAPYRAQVQQYRALATCSNLYQPLHKAGEYRIPMIIGDKNGQYSIEMDGSINGKEGRFLFDTGAGLNMITPQLAKEYGLRSLYNDITVAGVVGMKQGGYAIADTLRIGGMIWVNVPFVVIDTHTGHEEADKYNEKFQLPPVIGLPIMLRMQEIQLDFANHEIIVPATPTPALLDGSNLLRTEYEGLQLKTFDEAKHPLFFHFDTGSYYTYMQPAWYSRHQKEVETAGVPDSLRMAGIGGVTITRTYRLPQMNISVGSGTTTIDSINVNTGIDLHTGQLKTTAFSDGTEDGVLGLNVLEKFSKVIINLKDMYMEVIPYSDRQ